MLETIKRRASGVLRRVGPPVVNRLGASRRGRLGLAGCTNRRAFLAQIPKDDVLEIGPFGSPALSGAGVRYFDVIDAAALRERASDPSHAMDPARVPEMIHYVSPTGDLSVVDRTFAAVFSSHAIEHQPDLVAHLNAVDALLPPGGACYLIVPDKRFCFDHYVALTMTADVVRAHEERRSVHTRAAVLAHRLETTHNDALRHWLGRHGTVTRTDAERAAAEMEARAADAGTYVDVHSWTFSPESFRAIMLDLRARGLIGLDVTEVADTGFGALEFYAMLRKPD